MRSKSKDIANNPMKEVKLGKLCLHICVGEDGDRLTRAAKVVIDIFFPFKSS